MATKGVRSLEPLLAQIDKERIAQLQHFDSLDAKAGIVLGLAGALIALSGGGDPVFVISGRAAAVISAGCALWAFWPRTLGVVNMAELREHYLSAEEAFTKLSLLDTQIEMLGRTRPLLQHKARRLKLAMSSLAGSALLLSIGTGLH